MKKGVSVENFRRTKDRVPVSFLFVDVNCSEICAEESYKYNNRTEEVESAQLSLQIVK